MHINTYSGILPGKGNHLNCAYKLNNYINMFRVTSCLFSNTGVRVRRLLTHPSHNNPSCILSSVQGNNEVSIWDLETGARQKTLWASLAPPLSQTKASSHSVNGMYLGVTDSNTFLLTAGSDMRIRYWDLSYPANSHIVSMAASDPVNQAVVSYRLVWWSA